MFGTFAASAAGTRAATGALRVALPKGTLYPDAVGLLAASGADTSALADPGRQLIVETGDREYVMAKPFDVAAYVARGAVDAGIVGKDVLIEADERVVEMADLGFGGCRFVVAEPEDASVPAEERYRHFGVVRVATKYPRITEAYYASKGVQVEVIRLNGNIEIAPLIGLADQVVDITATGRTLRENGLRVVEEVLASTARFVANPISLRTDPRVEDLARRLVAAAGEA